MINISLINLGCAKNIVDSEAILNLFSDKDKFLVTSDLNKADLIILNTCAFIHDAENESFDYINEISSLGKKTIVVGCLVEKYHEELKEKFPKINLFVGFKDLFKLPQLVSRLLNDNICNEFNIFERMSGQDDFSTFVKISEGCNHNCGYCIIPKLRGKYYSYKLDDIVNYVKKRITDGVKDFTFIAQDTSYYGLDFPGENINLSSLLKEIDDLEGMEMFRVLYLYPSEVSDELIETFSKAKHLLPYFDLPIQHASDKVLKLMNRNDSYESLASLVKRIKEKIPNAILRCTIIVGYPGETEEDFEILKRFLQENKFHHVGVFTFSNEKGTKAYTLPNHVDLDISERRKVQLMNLQKKISYQLNENMVGKTMKGIVIGIDGTKYKLRTVFNAPDGIDGSVYMESKKEHKLGDIVTVKITDAFVYDLYSIEL
ncbi:MAG: 30S ribosomal protein S12 methylthiotransferase RimO [Candidatus Onthovivens sp.]|nr:30S ribosomal protein S12 methylthiotransferase RimO [Candidatus Onthovivens sp.]